MGKCVRIRGSSKPPSPPSTASCLTLRSGRRVMLPVATSSASACSARTTTRGRLRRRHRGASVNRWCGGAEAAKKSACGISPRRSGGAAHAERPEEEDEVPSPAAAEETGSAAVVVARGGVDHGRGDSFERSETPLLTDDDCYATAEKAKAKHENESHHCNVVNAAGQMPPTEAEIESFFAAAELAERRRFAEAYNYDVALDRPLAGRFEWAPVSA